MVHEIKSRIFRGAVGQALSQIVTIVIQFASMPIFLLYWGVDLYGEWLILSAIPSYLMMSDLGFGGTAAREMAMMVSGDKRDKALCVFQSVWLLVTLISFLLLAVGSVSLSLLPIGEWFHFGVMEKDTVVTVLALMVLQVLMHLQSQMIYAGYNSEGYYGLGTIWLTGIRFIEFIFQMLAVIIGYGPIEVIIVALVARSVSTLFMRLGLYKVSPWVVYGVKHISWNEIKRLTTPAISALAFPLGQALNLQGARIIVGLVLGPAMVVTFTALRTLTRFIAMALTMVNRIAQPEISIAYGKDDMNMLRRLYRRTCQLSLWGSMTLCIMMYFIGGYIFNIWTAGKLVMDDELFFVMLVASALQAIWSAAILVLYATNKHSKVAAGFIISNILFISLAYVGLQYSGITLMMWFLAACEAVMLFLILPSSLRFTNDNFRNFATEVIKPPFFLINIIKNR